MITVKQLKQEFQNGEEKQILFKDVNFQINKGEFVIITGPSGSGKSTLLNILNGALKPTAGRVLFHDRNIYSFNKRELERYRLKDTGYIYQDFMLIDELNAYDNIILLQEMIGNKDRKYVDKIIRLLEIEPLLKKYPKVLSGGEKQKVAITRALVNKPEVLFCDEPTGSLDYKMTIKIMDILKKMNEELHVTIILVTHELELLKYANKLLIYENGKIKCESNYL